jgi:hypothetical protein
MAVSAGCLIAAASLVLVVHHDASGRALCTALGQQGGAPPGDPHQFLTTQVIATGQYASDLRLRAAAKELTIARDGHQADAIDAAEGQVRAACVGLGEWRVYH